VMVMIDGGRGLCHTLLDAVYKGCV
jgi:hypothetical protein